MSRNKHGNNSQGNSLNCRDWLIAKNKDETYSYYCDNSNLNIPWGIVKNETDGLPGVNGFISVEVVLSKLIENEIPAEYWIDDQGKQLLLLGYSAKFKKRGVAEFIRKTVIVPAIFNVVNEARKEKDFNVNLKALGEKIKNILKDNKLQKQYGIDIKEVVVNPIREAMNM